MEIHGENMAKIHELKIYLTQSDREHRYTNKSTLVQLSVFERRLLLMELQAMLVTLANSPGRLVLVGAGVD